MENGKEKTNLLLIRSNLRICNYVMLPDFVGNNKEEWVAYRKALRDLPLDPNWPDVVFPERPADPPLNHVHEDYQDGDE